MPVYLDVAGEQIVNLYIVDEIPSDNNKRHAVGLLSLTGPNSPPDMYILDGFFSAPTGQGCTTFLHERYHALRGDWEHEFMPHNCQATWLGLK